MYLILIKQLIMESQRVFIPTNFYCPITGELMLDPVTDNEGNSYEKSKIFEWISKKKTSPLTRNFLDETHLTENEALKRSIESIKDQLREDQLKIDTVVATATATATATVTDVELNSYYLDDKLFVNIKVPDIDVREPVDIVLCIDVSYSMFNEATLKGDSNETVGHGFSVLSLTVAASKTILHSLKETDNISIVTYSSSSETIFENVPCTPENKAVVEEGLDQLKPICNTNMWAGIVESLDILRKTSCATRNKGILLLTDGIPNVEPPRGHAYMLEKYFRDHNFRCMLSCYGFGYNLDSELLMELSNISGGDGYSFIPDASILGTAFIHGVSNLLTTFVYSPTLEISLYKGVVFETGTDNVKIQLDSLKYGQEKNIVLDLNTKGAASQSLEYFTDFAKISLSFKDKTIVTQVSERPSNDYFIINRFRTDAVQTINSCIQKKKFNDASFRDILNQFISDLEKESANPYIRDLLYDFNGQVKEALNMTRQGEREDWFSRWGIHYLRSLQGTYQNELCNNFKDKAISGFGGGLFNNLRDEISGIFDVIPPPKRDVTRTASQQGVKLSFPPAPVNMRSYNNASGGCCAEGCNVLMENQTYKKVEEIVKGDILFTCNINNSEIEYNSSEIECVVKTKCENGKINMVTHDKLRITPYHPIIKWDKWDKSHNWIFPRDICEPIEVECDSMYTFVMKNRQSIFIEGNIFATYGHNLTGEVIEHNYFGTERVVNDLKKYTTYGNGIVELTQNKFVVDMDLDRPQVVGMKD